MHPCGVNISNLPVSTWVADFQDKVSHETVKLYSLMPLFARNVSIMCWKKDEINVIFK